MCEGKWLMKVYILGGDTKENVYKIHIRINAHNLNANVCTLVFFKRNGLMQNRYGQIQTDPFMQIILIYYHLFFSKRVFPFLTIFLVYSTRVYKEPSLVLQQSCFQAEGHFQTVQLAGVLYNQLYLLVNKLLHYGKQ